MNADDKHLGVIFSNNGFWHDHVDYIVKKSYTRLNMLRKVRMTLDRFSLEKIYMSFIRPILEYADVIWDSQNQNLINKKRLRPNVCDYLLFGVLNYSFLRGDGLAYYFS
jgi:hypothetical protein